MGFDFGLFRGTRGAKIKKLFEIKSKLSYTLKLTEQSCFEKAYLLSTIGVKE